MLSNADLRDSVLQDADLQNAQLDGADLSGCNLKNAFLQGNYRQDMTPSFNVTAVLATQEPSSPIPI